MKKVAAVGIIGLFALASCQKETGTSPVPVADQNRADADAVYMFSDGPEGFQRVELDANALAQGGMKGDGQGNAHAHGNYGTPTTTGFYKRENVRFSGTQNANGVFGNATIERFWGDNGEYSFTINLTADCLESNGPDAVYACVVNAPSTGTLPPQLIQFLGGDYSVGTRFWIRVRDNGQGANAPADQANVGIVWNSGGTIPCSMFGLSSFIWFINPMVNVANASDQIVVND